LSGKLQKNSGDIGSAGDTGWQPGVRGWRLFPSTARAQLRAVRFFPDKTQATILIAGHQAPVNFVTLSGDMSPPGVWFRRTGIFFEAEWRGRQWGRS
jgi:hypothetical protein